jgi:hypothetical protein
MRDEACRRTWLAVATVVLGAWALAGCGGGGGGGGSEGVPPVVSGPQPLQLTAQNLADVTANGVGVGESVLLIGQLAADVGSRLRTPGAGLTSTQTCPNGGLMIVTVQDRDGSGGFTAGDRLVAEMRDCGVATLSTVLAGTVTVDFTTADAAPSEALRGSIDLGNPGVSFSDASGPIPGVTVRLAGTLGFQWSRSDLATSLRVLSTTADDLRAVASGGGQVITESYRSLDLARNLRYDDARTSTTLAMRIESEALGGVVTMSTPLPLKSYLNTYPDDGRVELRGAGTGVIRVKPHFVTASEQFDAELDTNGDGTADTTNAYRWLDVAEGFLWWDGVTALPWNSQPYSTQPYTATGFSYNAGNFTAPGVNDSFRLQFSRPTVSPMNLTFRFRDDGSTLGYDPVRQNVSADVVHQGALYLIRPSASLRHARYYALEASTDGMSWSSQITVRDALNNMINLYGGLGNFTTADSLRAVIAPSSQLLTSATASLQLSAVNSISTLRPISSYRWAQIGGTPLAFSAPQAAETTVQWGATPPTGLEAITVELTITDTAGEVETSRVTLNALNPGTQGHILYFRGAAGDYISGGQTVLVADSTGSFSTNPMNSGYVTISYNEANFASWWTLNLATADSSPLKVGAYEGAVRAPFHGNQNGLELTGSGRGCNSIVGRFDVLEVDVDMQGVITRLAVDFEQHCESAQAPTLLGSLRINSTLPIRP